MEKLSASILPLLEPGVPYAPGTLSRKIGSGTRTHARRCAIFLAVAEGMGLFARKDAGLTTRGIQRKLRLIVYNGPRAAMDRVVAKLPLCQDWLEYDNYRTRQLQKITRIVLHYLYTRPSYMDQSC
jgi:hypothetical protein